MHLNINVPFIPLSEHQTNYISSIKDWFVQYYDTHPKRHALTDEDFHIHVQDTLTAAMVRKGFTVKPPISTQ